MRILSYRNKRLAKRLLLVLVVVFCAVLLLCLGRLIYLQRFLVYRNNKAELDYSQTLRAYRPKTTEYANNEFPMEVLPEIDDYPASSLLEQEMKPLNGCYISTTMLQDIPSVIKALEEYPDLTAVMIEMKSIHGSFYYKTSIPGAYTASVDLDAMNSLLSTLKQQNNIYMVAKIPAFSDSNFALDNQSCGLPLSSGALWMDSKGCYWLNPLDEEVQDYLYRIAAELAGMGFHEIVFDGFRIPDSTNIVYKSEQTRDEVAASAAQLLRENLNTLPVRISFGTSNLLVAEHTDRLYLDVSDGSSVSSVVETYQDALSNVTAQLVFVTSSRDTRFESYGVLRPLFENED